MKPALFLGLAMTIACASSGSDSGTDASVDSGTDADTGNDSGSGGSGSGGVGGNAGAGGGEAPSERLVFVTAAVRDADFDGLEGADALCADEALAAGLAGEFKAWLSTLGSPVSNRLNQSAVPYVLVDGTRIADDWADLTDGSLLAPIDLDAMGQSRDLDVWTGTLPSGESYAVDDCAGYTSNSAGIMGLCGTTQSTGAAWSASQTPACGSRLRLFCFEQ